MEVDTDDDLLASHESSSPIQARSIGPPPDVTHHYLKNTPRYQKSTPGQKGASNTATSTRTSEYQPLLLSGETSMSEDHYDGSDFVQLSINNFEDDPEYNDIIRQVEFAIDHNIMPQRIYEGSSGSYFAKNSEFVIKISCFEKNKMSFFLLWFKENCGGV